jgi:hypothetical protein
VATAALLLIGATAAIADQWNERTTLTFSEAVMVPGATLQPGTYVFQLMKSATDRHVVQITKQDGENVVITQAVPMKRPEPKGDVVLKFSSTDTSAPPAIKAWFYPGSVYGHEFIYPEDQAKQIAQRTKTIVLSVDVPGTDLEKGTLRTYDQSGMTSQFHADPATMQEWNQWRQTHTAAAAGVASTGDTKSSAPMIRSDFQANRVAVGDLEEHPQDYTGKTVSVDAEVEEVFGPRLFTIDERNWGDLDGEILVFVPTPLAALVKDDDQVTITGTVKPFVKADVEREWGWLGLDPEVEVDFNKKPVLVASKIVGGNNDVAMVIQVAPDAGKPVGTSGMSGTVMSDISAIARGDEDLVGRHVDLTNVRVEKMAKDGGFFVNTTDGKLFVLPADANQMQIKTGSTVSLTGVILQMPSAMASRIDAPAGTNDDIYIYAQALNK